MGAAGGIALLVLIFVVGCTIVALLVRSTFGGGGSNKRDQSESRERPDPADHWPDQGSGAARQEQDHRHQFGAQQGSGNAWYLPGDAPPGKASPEADEPRGAFARQNRRDPNEERPYYMPDSTGPRKSRDDDGYGYD